MNGCIIPGTPIAVDFWQVRQNPGIKLFFLTHLHGDHIIGLTSSWRLPIYCSPLTGQLLIERYGVRECVVRSLEVGQSHLIRCCQYNCAHSRPKVMAEASEQRKADEEKYSCYDLISVTVIDACHCAGAVMFLFEGPFGKILHTGDFRYTKEMFEEGSPLSKHIGTIDTVFLDNTYCSPQCVFPSRLEALEEIINTVKNHSSHDVVFGVRHLGKEELLAAVALALGEWINVPPVTLSFAKSVGLPNVFQTGQPDSRLRAVPFHTISNAYVRQLNRKKATIVILPTALYEGIGGKPYINSPEVFVIPYSDHSSYPELLQFVSKLKPARVKPVVQGKVRGPFGMDVSSRQNMNCFQKYLSKPQTSRHVVSSCTEPNHGSGSKDSYGQHHSSCRFGDLFPDFRGPLVGRKKKVMRKTWKTSCAKGVNYMSDDEVEVEASPERNEKTKKSRVLYSEDSGFSPGQMSCNQHALHRGKQNTVCPLNLKDKPTVNLVLPKTTTQVSVKGTPAQAAVDVVSQKNTANVYVEDTLVEELVSDKRTANVSVNGALALDLVEVKKVAKDSVRDTPAVELVSKKYAAKDGMDTAAVDLVPQRKAANVNGKDMPAEGLASQKKTADGKNMPAEDIILQKKPGDVSAQDMSTVDQVSLKKTNICVNMIAVDSVSQQKTAKVSVATSAVDIVSQEKSAYVNIKDTLAVDTVSQKQTADVNVKDTPAVGTVSQKKTVNVIVISVKDIVSQRNCDKDMLTVDPISPKNIAIACVNDRRPRGLVSHKKFANVIEDRPAVDVVSQKKTAHVSVKDRPAVDVVSQKKTAHVGVKDKPAVDVVSQKKTAHVGVKDKPAVDVVPQKKTAHVGVKDRPAVDVVPQKKTAHVGVKDKPAVDVVPQKKTAHVGVKDRPAVDVVPQKKTAHVGVKDRPAVDVVPQKKTAHVGVKDRPAVDVVPQKKTAHVGVKDRPAVDVVPQKKTAHVGVKDRPAVDVDLQKKTAHVGVKDKPAVDVVPQKKTVDVIEKDRPAVDEGSQNKTFHVSVKDRSTVDLVSQKKTVHASVNGSLAVGLVSQRKTNITLKDRLAVSVIQISQKKTTNVSLEDMPVVDLITEKKTADACFTDKTVENIGGEDWEHSVTSEHRTSDEPVCLRSDWEEHESQDHSGAPSECVNCCKSESNHLRSARQSSTTLSCSTETPDILRNMPEKTHPLTSAYVTSNLGKRKFTGDDTDTSPCSPAGEKMSQRTQTSSESAVQQTRLHAQSVDDIGTCLAGSYDSVSETVEMYLAYHKRRKKCASGRQQRAKLMDLYNSIFGPDTHDGGEAAVHNRLQRSKQANKREFKTNRTRKDF